MDKVERKKIYNKAYYTKKYQNLEYARLCSIKVCVCRLNKMNLEQRTKCIQWLRLKHPEKLDVYMKYGLQLD